jgi:hypothetical protein
MIHKLGSKRPGIGISIYRVKKVPTMAMETPEIKRREIRNSPQYLGNL